MMCFPLILALVLGFSTALYLPYSPPHYEDYRTVRPSYFPNYGAANFQAQMVEPYRFGYNLQDYEGNHQYRFENSNHQNTKTGTYGYRDVNGIFRHVNYIADRHGFRVVVDTNEPGTAPAHPANAVFNSAPVHVVPVRAPSHFVPAENIWYQGFGNAFGRRIGSESSVGLAKRSRRQRRKNTKGRRLVPKKQANQHQ